MMGAWVAFAGAFRYEFRMQARRKAVWITVFAVSLLLVSGARNPWNVAKTTPLWHVVSNWAFVLSVITPIGIGVMLADRLPRDRRTRSAEVLDTLPASFAARLWGKYLGSTLATLLPVLTLYAAGLGYILARWHDARAIPYALVAFAAINLPGALFVGAFSVCCPALFWVPLYQFLFVGYWFWGNLVPPEMMPTLSGTWLSPVGGTALAGLFHDDNWYTSGATAWSGVGSIALLLASAAIALQVTHAYILWRNASR
jgi:ABC-2 type transport system permease protein